MGRTVYWMNVSLDLRIEHAPNEQGGGSWLRIGEELHREFNTRAAKLAMFIQGRVIYETMEAFWPQAIDDATLPEFMREYGRIWTEKPKVLVSSTRREARHETRIIGGPDAIDRLAELRQEVDGDIGVGGATVASALLRAGLLDEVLLFVHPVILETGRPLFDAGAGVVNLDLLEDAAFPEGVTMQRYAVRR